MYSAMCPNCDAILTNSVFGQAWIGCQCDWAGNLIPPPPARTAAQTQTLPLEVRRDHARALLVNLASVPHFRACRRNPYGAMLHAM
ncbi:MAG TPA: hypothetical protein VF120_03430 [Ktedonobacterales bacterium]